MCKRVYHLPETLWGPESIKLRKQYTDDLLNDRLHENVRQIISQIFAENTFEAFTPIQIATSLLLSQPIYHDSAFFDIVLCAPTGCGKTLAYVIPILSSILRHCRYTGKQDTACHALILVPTRELAKQVAHVARQCTHFLAKDWIQRSKTMSTSRNDVTTSFVSNLVEIILPTYKCRLRDDNDDLMTAIRSVFVVSTPGKFLDFVHYVDNLHEPRRLGAEGKNFRSNINSRWLRSLLFVIYDEADKFLEDLNFMEWNEEITTKVTVSSNIPRKILVSATGQIQDAIKLEAFQLNKALFILRNPMSVQKINTSVDAIFQMPTTLIQYKARISFEQVQSEYTTYDTVKVFGLCYMLEELNSKWAKGTAFDDVGDNYEEQSQVQLEQTNESICDSFKNDSLDVLEVAPILFDKVHDASHARLQSCSTTFPKTIIFCNKISTARYVYECLSCHIKLLSPVLSEENKHERQSHIALNFLSSQLAKIDRLKIFQQFVAGKFNVLVTTDILSRGVNISDVDLVVNFDLPKKLHTYIHRVGRTARAGRIGRSVILYSPRETRRMKDLFSAKKNIQLYNDSLFSVMDLLQNYPELDKPSLDRWATYNQESINAISAIPLTKYCKARM